MKLALSLPWNDGSVTIDPGYNPEPELNPIGTNLGSVITRFGEIAIYVGAFLMFLWALWGVFDYLKAEGNKEALAKARKKIIWAISGFVILILAFFVGDVIQTILNPGIPSLTKLTQ